MFGRVEVFSKMKSLSYQSCHFGYRQGFKHKLAGFSLPCHSFCSCINTVYSLFYRMHMKELNRLIQFFLMFMTG